MDFRSDYFARDHLLDETHVVRGGLMELPFLRKSLETGLASEGTYNLSFWGENGLTVAGVVLVTGTLLPQPKIRVSTVGDLRGLGLEPFRSAPWPHLTIMFATYPSDIELNELVGAFGPPTPKPDLRA